MTNFRIFSTALILATLTIINPVTAEQPNPKDSSGIDEIMKIVNDTSSSAKMLIISDSTSLNIHFIGNKKSLEASQAFVDGAINEMNPDSLDFKKDALAFKMALDFYNQQYNDSIELAKNAIKSGKDEDLFDFAKGLNNVYCIGKFLYEHPVYSKLNFPFLRVDKAEYYIFTAGDLIYAAYNNMAMDKWTKSLVEKLKLSTGNSSDVELLKLATRKGLYLIAINDVLGKITTDLMVFEEILSFDMLDPYLPRGPNCVDSAYRHEVQCQIDHILRVKDEKSWINEWFTGPDYLTKTEDIKGYWEEAKELLKSLNKNGKITELSHQIQKEDSYFARK